MSRRKNRQRAMTWRVMTGWMMRSNPPQSRRPGSGTYLRVLPRTTHISPICKAGGAEEGMKMIINIYQIWLITI